MKKARLITIATLIAVIFAVSLCLTACGGEESHSGKNSSTTVISTVTSEQSVEPVQSEEPAQSAEEPAQSAEEPAQSAEEPVQSTEEPETSVEPEQPEQPEEPDTNVVANYFDDFSTADNNNWVYGYATDYQWDGEHKDSFTFNALTAVDENEWGGKDGIIIKKDWILSESGDAAIGYKVQEGQKKLSVKITFEHSPNSETDGVSPTRFAVRLLVVGSDRYTKTMQYLYNNTSSFEFTREVEVAEGDIVYAVLFKEADGWRQGKIQIEITKVDVEEAPQPLEVANYFNDFSTAGNNNWVYGYATDYQWDGEHKDSFTFNALTAVGENEWGGKEGVIIKKDWILSEGGNCAAIGFKVQNGQTKLSVTMNFAHSPNSETDGVSPTRFALRLLVVGSDDYTKSMQYLYNNTSSFEFEREVEVTEGDIVYVVMFREAEGWEQGRLQITISK